MKNLVCGLAICIVASAAWAEGLGEEANRAWTNAQSQFAGGRWDQALPLLDTFTKKYPSHERIGTAYMDIAYCKAQLKDAAGADAALEQVLTRFPQSFAWQVALSAKLQWARAAKANEAYVVALEKALPRVAVAPMDLPEDIGAYLRYAYEDYWRQNGRQYYVDPFAAQLSPLFNTKNWMLVVPQMANTPELAKRALAALTKTFNTLKKDLPAEWQFVQYALIKQSGQVPQADKYWEDTLADWGDDPRAEALWVLRANHSQVMGEDKDADDCWVEIVKKYNQNSSLGESVFGRLSYLQEKDRFEPFVAALPLYFKTDDDIYGNRPPLVLQWVAGLAVRKADQGDNSRIEPAIKALDEIGPKDPGSQRLILILKADLLSRAKDFDQAAKLATQLYSDDQWCSDSAARLADWAPRDAKMKAVYDAARKKYGIEDVDPASPAGLALEKLKGHLKAEEARHAEELVTDMTGKYPKDPATIEAVKLLSDYYFAKLMPELRDKWMDFMVRTYTYHPLTQAVLHTQITAETAAKRYDRLAQALDTMFGRFKPTMANLEYYNARYNCIVASTKDAKAARDYSRKHWAAWTSAGQLAAVRYVMYAEEVAATDNKTQQVDNKLTSPIWFAFSQQLQGTRTGLYCLGMAWQSGYWNPYYPWFLGDRIMWDDGKKYSEALMNYKADPEIQWRMVYADINWMAAKGTMKPAKPEGGKADPNLASAQDHAKAMLAAINGRLKDGQQIRDLSMRLDFWGIGSTLGKAKMIKESDELVAKLQKICFTQRDKDALELLQGFAHGEGEDYARGAQHLLNLVHASRWPAGSYGMVNTALTWLGLAKNPGVAQTELDKYLTSIATVPNMVPPILQERLGAGAIPTLKARFPASNALEVLLKQIEDAKKPPAKPEKK